MANLAYMTGVSKNDASFIVKQEEELLNIGYQMTQETFDARIRAYAKTYNYTINENAIIDAIRFMYTPWMQPDNASLLMEEYVNVSELTIDQGRYSTAMIVKRGLFSLWDCRC